MLNSTDKIIYLALFFLFFVVRKYYTGKYRTKKLHKSKVNILDIVLLTLDGIAMVLPLVYVFSDILDFADYNRPFLVNFPGIIILTTAIVTLWFSHHDLSSNWTPTLGIKEDHKLIKTGVYKYIRHPMYTAHILWSIGQIAVLPNWIAGFSFIIITVPHLLSRIKDEEEMMIEQFGEEYKNYKKTTGIIFPKIKSTLNR